MRNNQLFFRHRIILVAAFTGFVLMAFFIPACKGKKSVGSGKALFADSTFGIQSLKLSKAAVQQWVDSGWTNPADTNKINKLLIQFYSVNPSTSDHLQLLVYPGKNMMNVHLGGQQVLTVDSSSGKVGINQPIVFANNVIDLSAIGIIKGDGTLTNFDYVIFKPVLAHAPYLVFAVSVVTAGTAAYKVDTNPCPPCEYCNPPNCINYE